MVQLSLAPWPTHVVLLNTMSQLSTQYSLSWSQQHWLPRWHVNRPIYNYSNDRVSYRGGHWNFLPPIRVPPPETWKINGRNSCVCDICFRCNNPPRSIPGLQTLQTNHGRMPVGGLSELEHIIYYSHLLHASPEGFPPPPFSKKTSVKPWIKYQYTECCRYWPSKKRPLNWGFNEWVGNYLNPKSWQEPANTGGGMVPNSSPGLADAVRKV